MKNIKSINEFHTEDNSELISQFSSDVKDITKLLKYLESKDKLDNREILFLKKLHTLIYNSDCSII